MVREILQKNVKKKLDESGLTKVEAARRMGISEQTIYYWEIGRSAPDINNVEKMAELFGCSPLWFYRDHDKEDLLMNSQPDPDSTPVPNWFLKIVVSLYRGMAAMVPNSKPVPPTLTNLRQANYAHQEPANFMLEGISDTQTQSLALLLTDYDFSSDDVKIR